MQHAADQGGPLRLELCGQDTARPRSARAPARLALALAIPLVAACSLVLVVLAPASLPLRAAVLVVALIAALAAALAASRLLRRPALSDRTRRVPQVVVDDLGVSIARTSGATERLLALRPSFGVSILTSAARDKVVLALTVPGRLLCVGADVPVSGADRDRLRALLPLAVTVPGDDLVMATILPDHTVLVLPAASWLRLLDALVALDPSSTDRCFLSDSEGGPIFWTADRLRTSTRTFRLDQPFEWHAWAFHEAEGGVGATFQATSIRQGRHEVVFVALLGADVRASIHDAAQHRRAMADSFLMRDAHLSDAPAGAPPPKDRRVAMDRLFMLPLRRALDRSQCVNRPSVPGGASAP